MKKLYTGIAAAALAATGLACGTGAAHADSAPWALGYAPSDNARVSTAISDTTIYTAVVTASDTVDATSTDRLTGATTHTVVSLAAEPGYTVGEYTDNASVAVTSTGLVLVSTDQANDNTDDGTDDREGIWTAQLGNATAVTATETISGLDATGTLAVSPDGTHAALAVGWEVYAFAPSATTANAVVLADNDTEDAEASYVAVADDGTIYAAGDKSAEGDDDTTPTLWTLASGSDSATPRDLKYDALSVATAGSEVLVGESSEDDDSAYELETFDRQADAAQPTASVSLPDEPYYMAVSPDNGTVAASDGWDIYSLDLSKLGTYGDDNPILEGSTPDADDADAVDAVIPTADTVFAVTQSEDANGNEADAAISRVTKPGQVTDATQQVSGNEIDLSWTAPAQDGGSDLTYVVSATDKASGKVTTDRTQNTDDSLTGLVAGHTYDVTVRAENFAFQGDAVTVAPAIPGTVTITVSGNAVVGGTLTAAISKDTFPAGTTLSYQWGYSGGQYGGAIEGAEKSTYSPTKDMVGMRVSVIVTATHEGYSPTWVRSNSVLVKAAAHAQTPTAPQPAHVTKIKAAKIKSTAKKLTLKVAGVTTAPGKVKVFDGKKLIGKGTIKNGKLVLKLKKKLHKGKHKLTVKYAGSAQVASFTKSVKVKVK